MNAESRGRSTIPATKSAKSEHALEVAFTTQPQVVEQFRVIDRVEAFRRQLPVGVFDGQVSGSNRWSPGGKSQVDLWAISTDLQTVHLFELKAPENMKLGILAEALWYARLLHRIRVDDFGGKPMSGGGTNMDAVRHAQRIKMWLLTDALHPLVEHEGHSPLEWLREGLAGSGLELGILPYELQGDQIRLRPDRRWPSI